MKLTVCGATGGIGTQLVHQAVAQGHDVTVVVRDRTKVSETRVRVVETQLTGAAAAQSLEDAVAGADAVLSALGPRSTQTAGIATEGTGAILRAMTATGVRRISVVSAAPIDGPVPGDDLFTRAVVVPLLNTVFRSVYNDLRNMEETLRKSDRLWTAIRPPKLTNGRPRGRYRTSRGSAVPHGRFISRADVAGALLASLEKKDQECAVVGVAY